MQIPHLCLKIMYKAPWALLSLVRTDNDKQIILNRLQLAESLKNTKMSFSHNELYHRVIP